MSKMKTDNPSKIENCGIKEHLRKIQTLNRIGFWKLDLKTNELIWCHETCRIFGMNFSQHKRSYNDFLDSIHPEDRDSVEKAYETSLNKRTTYSVDHRIVLKNKKIKFVHENCETIYDSSGNPIRSVGTVQDISRWKYSEKKSKKEIEQYSHFLNLRSIRLFTGGMAHHYNNMLSVILGNVDLAFDKIDNTQSVYDNISEIKNAAQQSAKLTYQLLSFACHQETFPMILDINEVIHQKLDFLRKIVGKSVDLKFIPSSGIGLIRMDPAHADGLLLNLCFNAMEAIHGKGFISIKTRNVLFKRSQQMRSHVSYVGISVRDNGSGIDPEYLSSIFEPFFTTKDIGNGNGLGMSIVYGIVKQNKGIIKVKSYQGRGTIIDMYFPTAEEKN